MGLLDKVANGNNIRYLLTLKCCQKNGCVYLLTASCHSISEVQVFILFLDANYDHIINDAVSKGRSTWYLADNFSHQLCKI